ncbi:MAG: methionine synthase [bacterium]|nr:methionine synthase [bacterium]
MPFRPALLPTAIGSLPHRDPVAAMAVVRRHLPECPYWPQLPRRDRREQMDLQFSEGLPGLADGDRGSDLAAAGEAIYRRYLEADPVLAIGPERAAGLYALAGSGPLGRAVAVKGQITGPLTLGLSLEDGSGRPLLYREDAMDLVVKVLAMRARWQERFLARLNPRTIIFVDEPSLATYGSGFFAYDRAAVIAWLTEVLEALTGLRGIHCCANTDWPAVLATPAHIVSFDAWGFARQLALYAAEVGAFLDRGGMLAWGIVPASAEVATLGASGIADRLEQSLDLFSARGLDRRLLLERALVTPSCGLGSLEEATAARALELTGQVAGIMRERHGLGRED